MNFERQPAPQVAATETLSWSKDESCSGADIEAKKTQQIELCEALDGFSLTDMS
jgi:hypothetical protein